ncbi:sugar phosphate isomerase/epimerase and 4-hydroxyphenylpyruvate domain-containing protein [Pseudomonas capeferrum]|uniref:bifunctional sugar phosphate isomerase/epimerase/4-hydroxyphenylpyruvate dioxygenase family protein n=1 Tax=Pseudomonas capeferrum TaxID=1495066 RepID=UPI0015E43118|nr:sugar phosphate isomerase/epimerase and 4-hydroxyphenylpyruvate domain-containing protein [Pseudomonas capeferrum]MBA1205153.1 sugar phosphate isomerase/epimerase and 4-hydroxyphenylpyruvate domain-containing protein [Pseudomonas capeferrum]
MHRSIATVSLSGTLPEKLEAIAAAGFDGVEIFENDLLCYWGSPGEVRQRCDDLGLAITLYQPFRDFEGCPREQLRKNFDRAERKFDLMQALGVDLMLMCSNTQADASGEHEVLVEDLHQLAERAGTRGLRVGYEGLAWGHHVNTWQQVWDLVRHVDHAALGMVLDSFHTLALKGDPGAIRDIPGEKIFFVQMADAPMLNMEVAEWSRHFRCFPGQGEMDMPGFLTPILETGYQGPLSLEIFNDGFRAAPARQNAADGLRSLLHLEEQCHSQLRQRGGAVASGLLFSPAAASACHGIESLEFAVDPTLGRRLGGWLERLGFAQAGRHRTRDVRLLRQGDINILLNSQPDGFAHDFFDAHGPSLSATTLRVDNSVAAVQRAREYGAQIHDAPGGPDQHEAPSLRAPDGSLIHLVQQAPASQRRVDPDFILDGDAQPTGTLRRIDHLALALPAQSLGSGALFYKSLIGFLTEDETVASDPYGLVRSRALRSPCGFVRLSLSVSQEGETAIAHALSRYRGAGLEHVAFACEDIFTEVARAHAAGVALLNIPRNYYDDLAARYDLDEAFLRQLARCNVLYDRDAQGGELLHAFTEPFEARFFFEIVQRNGGYSGYGAANTAIRLASMTQLHSTEVPRQVPDRQVR